MATYGIHHHTFPKFQEQQEFRVPSITQIRTAVCKVYGVSEEDLHGSSIRKTLAEARMVYVWFLRTLLKMSYPELGTVVHHQHTTCINAVRRVTERRGVVPLLTERMSMIASELLGPDN